MVRGAQASSQPSIRIWHHAVVLFVKACQIWESQSHQGCHQGSAVRRAAGGSLWSQAMGRSRATSLCGMFMKLWRWSLRCHQSSLPKLLVLQRVALDRSGPHKFTRAKMVTRRTSGTRQQTWNIYSAVLWFSVRALFLYCIPLFLLEFRMSFCDVLYWKYVIILVVFVVVSIYFVFLSIFLEPIVQKKYWTVRFLIWTVKSMGAFEVGLEVLCTLRWAWGCRG